MGGIKLSVYAKKESKRVRTKTLSQPSSIGPFDRVAQTLDGRKKLLRKVMFVI